MVPVVPPAFLKALLNELDLFSVSLNLLFVVFFSNKDVSGAHE